MQSSGQLEALRLLPSVWFRLLLPTSQRLVAAVAGGGAAASDAAAVAGSAAVVCACMRAFELNLCHLQAKNLKKQRASVRHLQSQRASQRG